MERKKYILLILSCFISFFVFGQIKESIYSAYLAGDMNEWQKTMHTFQPQTNKEKLELINYQYGYIAWAIDQGKRKEAKQYLKKAESIIDELKQKNYSMSMLYAYKAAFSGFKIALAPYKAPFIGPACLSYAKKSVELDSQNALSYMQLGYIAYFTPKIFGGSKPEAMKNYLQALEIMEAHENQVTYNWNYLNTLVTIINTFYVMESFEKAKEFTIKTRSIAPEFEWLKKTEFPKILKELEI